DLPQRQAAPFARLTQLVAETAHAFLCTHGRGKIFPPMLIRLTTSFIGRSGSAKRPIAATPPPPAAATSAARSTETPPMASTGTETAFAIDARPASPRNAVMPGFEFVGNTVPATR